MRSIDDYARWGMLLKPWYFDKLSIYPDADAVRDILANHPKLVLALNHGPGSSLVYVGTAVLDILLKNGGAQRHPLTVVWRNFYKVPGIKQFTRYLTQMDEPCNLDELVDKFVSEDFNDFLVVPEGENCMFGDGVDIQPFMSPRFLEVAIRAKVPVLLVVHYGTQATAKPIEVTKKQSHWVKKGLPKIGQKLDVRGVLSVPNFFSGKLPEIKFSFKLYRPKLTLKKLPKDKVKRLQLLNKEAEVVRAVMQDMVDDLKAASVT